MRTSVNLLPLTALAALLGNMGTPASGFRAVAPSIGIKKHTAPICKNLIPRHPSTTATTTLLLSSPDNENSREREMMEQALREQEFRQVQQMSDQRPIVDKPAVDPLIASLTRIDDSTPQNVPTKSVPLFGEVPDDDNLKLLLPVAAVSVLGFIFSIVVAFNSRDAIGREFSKMEIPEMKYTPTVIEEGKCRGLCSSQEKDVEGLRNFMESISRKD
mmetsp:Transcript_38465/g.80600  ORF Transcript_38465/g.80600 Transcript_38465/m.80600 type:complete len:216 (-) Transcript_38465:243-890(-)|eukprot:CAMPEP_0196133492 /NCGR_PEP_ID=MMETSP0910-20130528/2695_1 /TAXON_ID=49265 /ORGANISM="Thalassiosira rotula, Strain GSO102" /LENGTH=215 /DNA_ID=CAMNT_0041393223 /DNA_START=76 /DNA_END=723 /DNA_ORIENTATION=+